jgi:hypothetical protein
VESLIAGPVIPVGEDPPAAVAALLTIEYSTTAVMCSAGVVLSIVEMDSDGAP